MMDRASTLVVLMLAVITAPGEAQAPGGADPGRAVQTRADLERLLVTYEESLQSPAYSARVKEGLRRDIARIRLRLTEGDFRLGDRVALYVEGEPDVPETVSVEAGPAISLPVFGEISLRGVLRSEIEEHITQELGRFIREPVVRAQALMRVSIQGAVGNPGFYVVPASLLIGEALMEAGGPAANANLDVLRIERGATRLMEGEVLQEALRDGLTLDQLNLRAGDQIVVPERGEGFFRNAAVVVGIVGTLGWIVFGRRR